MGKMKYLLVTALAAFSIGFAQEAAWRLQGDAFTSAETITETSAETTVETTVETPAEIIILTPDEPNSGGAAWYSERVNLAENFWLSFSLYFGTKDAGGADGVAFVLSPSPDYGGETGGTLGYQGTEPFVAVRFDTYRGDDGEDADALNVTSPSAVETWGFSALPPNFEDGQQHPVVIAWNAYTRLLSVYFGASTRSRPNLQTYLPVDTFGDESSLTFGLTGGTGGASNLQYFVPGVNVVGGRPRAALMSQTQDAQTRNTLQDDCQVALPDPNLEAGLRQVLSKPAEPITCDDMARLESFSFPNAGIRSVEGLQYATNLRTLELDGNQIDDLTPLEGLTALSTLNLNANWISDLAPLAGLTNLQSLGLARNYTIGVLEPLAGLAKLQTLSLSENSVMDVSPLESLVNLTFLDLSRNTINSFAPLVGNAGLGENDLLLLGHNCFAPTGSEANVLDALTGRTNIQYEPQTPDDCASPDWISRTPEG